MLKDISKMEQRYDAVMKVMRDGFSITEIAASRIDRTRHPTEVLHRLPNSTSEDFNSRVSLAGLAGDGALSR